MKRLTIAATLIVSCIPAYSAGALAQTHARNPVKVDSKHYKVEFENDKVRVLRVSYGPGETSVMHYNPDAVIVSLTGDKTRMSTPDGKSREDSTEAGGVIWAPAGSRLPQNVSDHRDEVIIVELKK
jgi:quercetin dioxygenase-like cupin family protein